MKPPPTDFQLLRAIYERHRGDYLTSIKKGGHAKIAVPIDIPAIAQDIGADADTVFGRLYHHLDPLYGTQNEDGSRKSLFIAQPGTTKDRINFPLLEAALAGLWQQRPNRAPFAYPWRERVCRGAGRSFAPEPRACSRPSWCRR